MVRTMLNKNTLPKYFWAEAINTACFILNCVLIRSYLNKLPVRFGKIENPTLVISKSLDAEVALIPFGDCTWRCYTRSITEQSLSFGPVARKFWFPADIHLSVKYQI